MKRKPRRGSSKESWRVVRASADSQGSALEQPVMSWTGAPDKAHEWCVHHLGGTVEMLSFAPICLGWSFLYVERSLTFAF